MMVAWAKKTSLQLVIHIALKYRRSLFLLDDWLAFGKQYTNELNWFSNPPLGPYRGDFYTEDGTVWATCVSFVYHPQLEVGQVRVMAFSSRATPCGTRREFLIIRNGIGMVKIRSIENQQKLRRWYRKTTVL